MTKEEIKANELMRLFLGVYNLNELGDIPETYVIQAKKSAIICVDEIIKTLEGMKLVFSDREIVLKEWQSVKQILESK